MHIVISNTSDLPIYAQIKEQVKEQISSGELVENETLPSLRQLAKDFSNRQILVGFLENIQSDSGICHIVLNLGSHPGGRYGRSVQGMASHAAPVR